jgi:hypothetical protein
MNEEELKIIKEIRDIALYLKINLSDKNEITLSNDVNQIIKLCEQLGE